MEETFEFLKAAFEQVDLELVRINHYADDSAGDFVLDPWGLELLVEVKRSSLVTTETAKRLVHDAEQSLKSASQEIAFMVVANRVTADARTVLTQHGWGYLDLRGHLSLRVGNRVVISAEVRPHWSPTERTEALAGKAGLEVATALLMNPDRPFAVRELARQLGRSPSTVSDIASSLRRELLIDEGLRPDRARLFWAMADRWPSKRTYLAESPAPGNVLGITGPLKLGLDDVETSTGWALTDSAAAAILGAPIAVRSDAPLDFFVPDETVARRAKRLLEPASSRETAKCSIRVAPVPAVCRERLDVQMNFYEWPVAHPLFVALDLAQDKGRGREILDDWNPKNGWDRAW
ncbi:transcriptional regulator [Nocardioides sp. KIGAM211]|uniref:Transcriptional regulator n=1 Tax=Nocardioides luti TaxID=2761101 RepID=A0A7X0RFT1_9ACTN|nr:transcriptional regulator [Nocardioides luti]MBB6627501.1 transcriptional regulator [Nocardioides luti]